MPSPSHKPSGEPREFSPSKEPRHDAPTVPPGSGSRAPVAGVAAAVVAVVGLLGWTAVRVGNATQGQRQVSAQRDADAERSRQSRLAPPVVEVVLGRPGSWQPTLELDGTLFAGEQAELGFETAGKLVRVAVQVGERVQAGALLGALDGAGATARLDAARARLRAAEAELKLAEDAERRTTGVVSSGVLAEAVGVETAQRLALARAQLDAARAEVSLLDVSLRNHRLLAPFGGSVMRAPAGVGSVVNPAEPLFELMDLSTLKFRGTLSQDDAALVAPGAALQVETEHGIRSGVVSYVLGNVDAGTRRVPLEARIDNRSVPTLRAGSFVRARVQGGQPVEVLALPPDTLRPGGQDEVLVIEGSRAVVRHITYHVDRSGALLVRRGVAPREAVVRRPRPELELAEKLEIKTSDSPSSEATQ